MYTDQDRGFRFGKHVLGQVLEDAGRGAGEIEINKPGGGGTLS